MKQLPTQTCNCFAAIAMVVDRVSPEHPKGRARGQPGPNGLAVAAPSMSIFFLKVLYMMLSHTNLLHADTQ